MNIEAYIKESSLYDDTKKIVLYRGVTKPKILFIGEAPGKEESAQGIPFVGRAGQVLNRWISEYQLEDQIGITNSVPLIPLSETKSIRKPSLDEINYFRPFVQFMIKKFKPKFVICLGDTATTSVLSKPIGVTRNKIFDKQTYAVIATYHPSYYLRRGDDGLADFKIIYDLISEIDSKENKE